MTSRTEEAQVPVQDSKPLIDVDNQIILDNTGKEIILKTAPYQQQTERTLES